MSVYSIISFYLYYVIFCHGANYVYSVWKSFHINYHDQILCVIIFFDYAVYLIKFIIYDFIYTQTI